jgi:uncharacterized RDD family membrane protein YckC
MKALHQIDIEIPEGVNFSLTLASPMLRGFSVLIDSFLCFILNLIFCLIISYLDFFSNDIALLIYFNFYFFFTEVYFILCEYFLNGQTIGKRLFGLRVVDLLGHPLSFFQVFLRNLLRFFDFIPGFYAIGGTIAFFHPRSQRAGDIVANTLVIRSLKTIIIPTEDIMKGRYNSFKAYPHLIQNLKKKCSPEILQNALHLISIKPTLNPLCASELFTAYHLYFQSLVDFPPDITHTLSAEQYVRNIVDCLVIQ